MVGLADVVLPLIVIWSHVTTGLLAVTGLLTLKLNASTISVTTVPFGMLVPLTGMPTIIPAVLALRVVEPLGDDVVVTDGELTVRIEAFAGIPVPEIGCPAA